MDVDCDNSPVLANSPVLTNVGGTYQQAIDNIRDAIQLYPGVVTRETDLLRQQKACDWLVPSAV